MTDKDGYRKNVGIILLSEEKKVFWGRRKGEPSWQFPQGGVYDTENTDQAMVRELNEELGLLPKHIKVLAKTDAWLYYDVPAMYLRPNNSSYKGQKQIWYLLKFLGHDYDINVKCHREQEFDAWRWVDYWFPVEQVIEFKRDVYRKAIAELAQYLEAE